MRPGLHLHRPDDGPDLGATPGAVPFRSRPEPPRPALFEWLVGGFPAHLRVWTAEAFRALPPDQRPAAYQERDGLVAALAMA